MSKLAEKRVLEKIQNLLHEKEGRREFLQMILGSSAVGALLGTSSKAEAFTLSEFFRKHYSEMTPSEKEKVFKRIKKNIDEEYKTDVTIVDPLPKEGVHFAYALNLSKCNGNRKCVSACVKENNQNREPEIQYIKVLEMKNGTFDIEKGEHFYEGPVPKEGKYYLPVQCQQCENPPCVKACPVKATWKEKDGIVVIDSEWCIGCRYCMAACPYEARRFNFKKPVITDEDINPEQGYLSNRIRPKGVVEKCTFCLHRTREGRYPACLEACPTGSRKFGNLLDPKSEISLIFKSKRVFVLKEELNTKPRFFYYVD